MRFHFPSAPPAMRLFPSFLLLFLLGSPSLLRSQTDNVLLFEVQDSMFIDLINDDIGDTTDPDRVWALYEFHMLSDSCRAIYTFTELKSAGARIELDNWDYLDFKKTYAAPTLSQMSRSRPFVVHAGDTLSFYREFAWFDPDGVQKPNNYYSEDDLEYVVRLKKTGTNVTLARLDSLGVARRVPSGVPYLYGNGPAYYIVTYVVPPIHNNKEVFVEVGLNVTGTGDYFPARRDDIGINLSAAVLNDCWTPFFNQYGGTGQGAASKNVRLTEEHSSVLNTVVTAASRTAQVTVDEGALKGRALSLSIYRMDGSRIFVSSWVGGENREVVHAFTESGSYIVALTSGNDLIASNKITVP